MRLCELGSPQGRRLEQMVVRAMAEAFPLLVEGAPGRALEDVVLHIRGTETPGDVYAVVSVELVGFATLFPLKGELNARSLTPAPGHVTVCAEAEGYVLLGLRSVSDDLLQLRRLHNLLVPSKVDSGGSPQFESVAPPGCPPLVHRLMTRTTDRVHDAIQSAAHLGLDLVNTVVVVGDAGVKDVPRRGGPSVDLGSRAIIVDSAVAAGRLPQACLRLAEGHVGVVYLARDGAAYREVPIPDLRGQTEKRNAHREPRAGRNEPCPCGSGRKFKRCCMN